MDNFREITEIFTRGEAVMTVRDGAELSRRISEWAADPCSYQEMGARARDLLGKLRGATEKNADLVIRELSRRVGETS